MLSTRNTLGLASMSLVLVCTLGLGIGVEAQAEAPAAPTETPAMNCQKMFRFYNPWTGEHLYTTSNDEAEELKRVGWTAEGVAWNSPTKDTPGVEKIYRLYNPYADDHMFTTAQREIDKNIKDGWKLDEKFEAYGFPSAQSEAPQAVYRMFNPYEKYHTHLFTALKEEHDRNVALGWVSEAPICYVPALASDKTDEQNQNSAAIVGGFSGLSSSSSQSEEPELDDYQKNMLTTYNKSVEELRKLSRENVLKGTTVEALEKIASDAKAKRDEVKADILRKSNFPGGAWNRLITPALSYKEAKYKAEYAKLVQTYNDAVNAAKQAGKNPSDDSAVQKALSAVEKKEQEVYPKNIKVSYERSKFDDNEVTDHSDQIVAIDTSIATQMYWSHSVDYNELEDNYVSDSNSNIEVEKPKKYYTEAAAVKHHDHAPFFISGFSRVRYDATKNCYVATYIPFPHLGKSSGKHPTHRDGGTSLASLAPESDKNNITGLPELNMSVLSVYGVDTANLHAVKGEDISKLRTHKADLEQKIRHIEEVREGIPSWRTLMNIKEFYETESFDPAVRPSFEAACNAFNSIAKECKEDKIDSDTYQALTEQLLNTNLKIAEAAYMTAKGEAHPDAATVKARYIDALRAAKRILTFPRDLLRSYDSCENCNEDYRVQNRASGLESLLWFVGYDPKQGKEKEYNEVIKALVQYMNDPTDANEQAYDDANAKYNRDED